MLFYCELKKVKPGDIYFTYIGLCMGEVNDKYPNFILPKFDEEKGKNYMVVCNMNKVFPMFGNDKDGYEFYP